MSNPYQPPSFDPQQFREQPGYTASVAGDHSAVRQVRIFAILNAVQGLLEIPMGLFTAGMGVLFPALMQLDKTRNANPAGGAAPDDFVWFITAIYFCIGIPVLVSGVLRIVAGVRNYRFRGRTLGMISLVAGLGSMLSCYCAPTAIGLLIYGLILFLNPAVKAAFAMAQQGQSAEQILAVFSPFQASYYPPASPPLSLDNPPPTGEKPFG
jgi:uncharacterized membrane protein HdeD (DUF308 family)